MKKIRLFTLLTLLVTLSLLLLVGCGKDDAISSIALKDHDPNTAIEIAVGELDYGAFTVVATYESGNTEEIALTKDMIAATDLVKLYQEGEHDITVTYGDQKCTFKVSVKRSAFKDLSFSENNVFTYDGTAHVVEVEGNIPANAVINYVGGNSFVNVGTYDVTAIVSCEGYVTERLSTTVKIERAKYDMSGVKFEAKEFVYDGQSHSVSISGTLPEGVLSPTYFIGDKETSSAVEAGEYKVIAKFANSDPNYETIPDMETTLKIIPAEYTVKGVSVVFKNEDGKLIDGNTKIYDGLSVLFDLNDYSKLSKKISVSFSVLDKDGNVISKSNKITNIKNAGVYTVKAEFTFDDSKNYQPIAPIVREFEVITAEYPAIENIEFLSSQVTYDGNAHSLAILGTPPKEVTVSYEYYLNNALVVDSEGKAVKSVTDAGRYTVKAIFTHADENRGSIPTLTAILNIEKIKVDASMLGFYGASSVEYTGTPYEPNFLTWKDANGAEHDILNYSEIKYYVFDSSLGEYVEMGDTLRPTDIGMYRFSITASVGERYESNYSFRGGENSIEITFDFNIARKKTEAPRVTFNGNPTVEYTGAAQGIAFTPQINSDLMTISTAYFRHASGGYAAMENGQIPTNVGSYRFVVTVSINEADQQLYVFPNGECTMEFIFDFEILEKVIEVPTVSFEGNNKTVIYNKNAQGVRYTVENAPAELVEISTSYYKLDSESQFVIMETGVLPTNVGSYKFVATIELKDVDNYSFSNEETSMEYWFEYEIQTNVVELPEVNFENANAALVYDGKGHTVDFDCSVDSEFFTITEAYYRLEGEAYVAMGENEIPLHAGSYKLVVTASINDELNCAFSNGEFRVEDSFEFVINKSVIELSAMGYVGNSVSSGIDRPYFKNNLDDFKKSALIFEFETVVRQSDDGGLSMVPDGVAREPGKYEFKQSITIKDTTNFIFSDGTTETVYVFSLEMK